MLTRKIGKLLRGSATPTQIMLACVIGTTLGFMPGFRQAGGLIVLLVLVLIILNANLALAALTGILAKVVSLAIVPVSFAVGRFLLDGPTQGLFKGMINAPVLALFGFEYYATTGGLVVGVILGIVIGMLVIRAVTAFRRKMSSLEESSEAFKKWSSKGWVKVLAWVFVGGGHKGTYADVLAAKGKVIRPIGVVFAGLMIALLVIGQMFFSGPIVTAALRNGLERANGATVDLESADADLRKGKILLEKLAMADPNALDTDLLRADRVEIDVSSTDLLRKRLTLDRVFLSNAANGLKRDVPGHIVGSRPTPSPAPPAREGEKTIEDYIEDAEKWKQRLAQIREWLEKMSGPAEEAGEPTAKQKKETLEQRIKRQIRDRGYANVAADHLIDQTPTLTVAQLRAEKVRVQQLGEETVDIHGENLSTHPHLLSEPPTLDVRSSADTLLMNLKLAGVSSATGQNTVNFAYNGLPTDAVADQLAVAGAKPISGGTIDLALQGVIDMADGGVIDMPLQVTLHNTTITIPGVGSAPVENLTLPLGLRGPIDSPAITLDDSKLGDALMAAGASALAGKVKGEADKMVEQAQDELGKQIGDKVGGELGDTLKKGVGDSAKGLLDGLLGGKKKDNP